MYQVREVLVHRQTGKEVTVTEVINSTTGVTYTVTDVYGNASYASQAALKQIFHTTTKRPTMQFVCGDHIVT